MNKKRTRRIRCKTCNELHERGAPCTNCSKPKKRTGKRRKTLSKDKTRCTECNIIISKIKAQRNDGKCNKCYNKQSDDVDVFITDGFVGAPTRYSDELPEFVYRFLLLGLTIKELADFLHTSVSTIYTWAEKHSDFREALNNGRMMADANVAVSLYKRATGFIIKEHGVHKVRNSTDKGMYSETLVPYCVDKEILPDFQSMKMWLVNRQPNLWRDRSEVEATIKDFDMSQLSEEERQVLLNLARNRKQAS